MSGFDYTLIKKPEAYSDSKGTIVGRPLYPSEVHGNLVALADAINAILGPLTQAQFGSRVDAAKMWVPVNFVYPQFPGMALPSDLMMGTWTNISANFPGDFFRAEGGNAAAFGGGVQWGQNVAHFHGAATGQDSGEHYHDSTLWRSWGISGGSGYSGLIDLNTNGMNQMSVRSGGRVGVHTHSISADGGNEARPQNRTILIWQRTA